MSYATMSEEYKKYVVDDLKEFGGIRRPIKASTMECMTVKMRSPLELHPNPEDEFSMPNIGPNDEIVGKYMTLFRTSGMKEPLMAEKIYPEGYMLLNGHHRWMAALRVGIDKVPVKVVNLVHAADIKHMMDSAEHDRRAVFDLDEVLWITDEEAGSVTEEKADGFFFEHKFKKRLHQYVPFLLQELNSLGYDIWVYTAGYYSVEEIEEFFKHYNVRLHGIVNGAGRGRKTRKAEAASVKAAVSSNYKETIHVDTGHILKISPDTGDYDYITLEQNSENWAVSVLKAVKGMQ